MTWQVLYEIFSHALMECLQGRCISKSSNFFLLSSALSLTYLLANKETLPKTNLIIRLSAEVDGPALEFCAVRRGPTSGTCWFWAAVGHVVTEVKNHDSR